MSENAWIEHKAGDRPLGPYAKVEVEFGDGKRVIGCACDFDWSWSGADPEDFADTDIAHYRLSGPSA